MNTQTAAKWPFTVQPVRMVRVKAHFLSEYTTAPIQHHPDPIETWLRLGAARLAGYPADVEEVTIPCSPKSAHEMLVFMQQHWDFPNLSWAELDLLAQIINLAGEYRK